MRIAIAPDVLALAATNDACLQALTKLEQDKGTHWFVVTQKLKKFYSEFLDLRGRPATIGGDLARAIARHFVSGTTFHYLSLDPECPLPTDIKDMFVECDLTDAEQHLISVAVSLGNGKPLTEIGPSVVLFLACSSLPPTRCLNRHQVREDLCRLINALEIHCAEDPRSIDRFHVDPRDMTNNKQHDARFQDQCTLWLTRKFYSGGNSGIRVFGHEIDSFCEAEMGGLHQVIIGECKLIHSAADKSEPHRKAVNQLHERVKALFRKHPSLITTNGVRLECFLFSNVPGDYDPVVKSMAREIENEYDTKIHFLRVMMPSRWQNIPDWNLRDEHFEDMT